MKATGTGAWTGQDGKIAFALDGAWRFYAPFNGLVVYVSNETKLLVYNGSSWVDYASVLALQNVPLLGVNTTADSTNKLAVASSAVLLNNIGAGIRAFINKHASGDTASFLFETNFSGRAEIGLTGDDNFHFKVSPDGATWYEGLQIDRNTGSLLLKHIDVTGTATIGATHLGRIVRADATGGAFAVTLPASADTDDWVIVRKKDSGANRVTVKDNSGNDVAWLCARHDEAMFAYWDGAWSPVRSRIAPLVQVFTSSGTYTTPPLAQRVDVVLFGPGGGGGSGRRGASGSLRLGGNPGSHGAANRSTFAVSSLGATETVTIGAGGTAGAAQTADSTNGNSGSNGGNTSFGSHAIAPGGNGGVGGSNAAAAVTSAVQGNYGASVTGPAASATAVATVAVNGPAMGSGGPGGSITAANAGFAGTNGSNGSTAGGSSTSGGTGGANTGVNGTAGADISSTADQFGGAGGGGGGANAAGVGGNGGAGGAPGGGGGGGGASLDGNNSGAGGAGGRGELRVTTYF